MHLTANLGKEVVNSHGDSADLTQLKKKRCNDFKSGHQDLTDIKNDFIRYKILSKNQKKMKF